MPSQTSDAPVAVYPDKLQFAGRLVTVGAKGFRVARLVLNGGGSARVIDLAQRVWGERRVPRTRLAEVLHRLNAKLLGLDCSRRFTRDSGRVLLI